MDTHSTLDSTFDQFAEKPTVESAGAFLSELIEYFNDGVIAEATLIGHLCTIRDWLQKGGQS